jgi:hypothetical protein
MKGQGTGSITFSPRFAETPTRLLPQYWTLPLLLQFRNSSLTHSPHPLPANLLQLSPRSRVAHPTKHQSSQLRGAVTQAPGSPTASRCLSRLERARGVSESGAGDPFGRIGGWGVECRLKREHACVGAAEWNVQGVGWMHEWGLLDA